MRNLLEFLSKYTFFIFFLLLEVVSFILIYNHNAYQHSRLVSSASFITGRMSLAFNSVDEYFGLKEVNRALAAENARLRTALKGGSSIMEYPALEEKDSLEYLSAKVISNSVQRRNNYFMINRGYADGIEPDMGVVAPEGIVGIIIDVSENFSFGISILHKNTRISARIKKNNQLVSVLWNGRNYRFGQLEDIPDHVHVSKGDTIITSGNSHIFPEGIMVGVVEETSDREGQAFKTASIRFSVDYNRLYYVYVIHSRLMREKINLESGISYE